MFPERFFDVGIAEGHAVTFAAGLAAAGLKPIVAVYSSFLQRAYDQILHDVCIQDLRDVLLILQTDMLPHGRGRGGDTGDILETSGSHQFHDPVLGIRIPHQVY